eukprot:1185269-Rhodomonas_salina.1
MTTRDSACTEPEKRDQWASDDDLGGSQLEPDHTRTQVSSRMGGRRISISMSQTVTVVPPNQDNDDQTRQHRRKRGARKKLMPTQYDAVRLSCDSAALGDNA